MFPCPTTFPCVAQGRRGQRMTARLLAGIGRSLRAPALGLALLGASAAAQAYGHEMPLDELVQLHSSQITWIATCGHWQAGQEDGSFRVVHAALRGQSLLYVQWMRTDANGRIAPVVTASVSEVTNDHSEIELSALRCEATSQGITVSARADFGHSGQRGRVRIEALRQPGSYRFHSRPR
jgi:hypothetical protein